VQRSRALPGELIMVWCSAVRRHPVCVLETEEQKVQAEEKHVHVLFDFSLRLKRSMCSCAVHPYAGFSDHVVPKSINFHLIEENFE